MDLESAGDVLYPIPPYSYHVETRTVFSPKGALRVVDGEIFGLDAESYSGMKRLETTGRFGGAFVSVKKDASSKLFLTAVDLREKASALFNIAFNLGCMYVFYRVLETALRP